MKLVLAFIIAFMFVNCFAETKLNEFTKGKYQLYGILKTSITKKTVKLVMFPKTRRELTVRLDGVNFRKALSFDGKLVEAYGNIEKRVIGKNIVFKNAKIVKIAPKYKKFYFAKKISK